ncbi:hypothetical protein N0V86_004120 [Didymella sp. IMI 355093]|nr:hypothetical protein N0V86_004120 [Didymella sp. IMI 355093]
MSYDSSYQENGESYLVADYNDSRMFLEPAAQHWVHQSATAASTADGSDIEYVDNPQISREVFSEHTPSYPPLDTSQTTSSLGDPYYSAPAAYGASSHSTADAGMAQGDRSTDSSLPRSVEGYAGYYTYRAESGYMAATNIPFTFSQLFPEAPFGALSNNQGSQDAMGETGVGSAAPYAHVQENDQAQPPWTVNHLPVDPGLHNYGARQSSISYGDVGRSELVCNVQEPLGMQSRTWGMVADPDTDLSGTDSTAHDFANSILDFQMDVDRQLSETIQAGQESVGMTSASEFRARLGISPDRGQSELRPYSQ